MLYTSTLRQFQSFCWVGLKRMYLADTGTDNLCRSTVVLSPCLWNSFKTIKHIDLCMRYSFTHKYNKHTETHTHTCRHTWNANYCKAFHKKKILKLNNLAETYRRKKRRKGLFLTSSSHFSNIYNLKKMRSHQFVAISISISCPRVSIRRIRQLEVCNPWISEISGISISLTSNTTHLKCFSKINL